MRKEDLQKIFNKAGPKTGFKGKCHACKNNVTIKMDMDIDGRVTISGGAIYYVQTGPTPTDKEFFFKCDDCFEKDAALRNYMPCEVYSRAIGYLRPVSQWNDGKQAEFALRSTFKV